MSRSAAKQAASGILSFTSTSVPDFKVFSALESSIIWQAVIDGVGEGVGKGEDPKVGTLFAGLRLALLGWMLRESFRLQRQLLTFVALAPVALFRTASIFNNV